LQDEEKLYLSEFFMTKVLFEINKNSLENNIIKYNKAHTDNFFVEEEIN
jgi:hypothetical protein